MKAFKNTVTGGGFKMRTLNRHFNLYWNRTISLKPISLSAVFDIHHLMNDYTASYIYRCLLPISKTDIQKVSAWESILKLKKIQKKWVTPNFANLVFTVLRNQHICWYVNSMLGIRVNNFSHLWEVSSINQVIRLISEVLLWQFQVRAACFQA